MATPRAARRPKVATPDYGLRVPAEIEAGLRRIHAPVRSAIQERLEEIAASAGTERRRPRLPDQREPPLRFYVYEGYRVVYRLDTPRRRVVVLAIELLPVD